MSLQSRILLAAPLVALLALPIPALSQVARPYFGAGLGVTDFRGACDGFDGPGLSCNENDTGVKIFGGYQFNRFAAFEFGYTDLGEARLRSGGGTQRVTATGVEFTGIGMIPLDRRFSLLGRAGVFAWNQNFHDSAGQFGSSSSSGSNLTFGFGVKYDLTRSTAVRFEWQRYKDVGDPNSNGGQGDIDLIGVNLAVKF